MSRPRASLRPRGMVVAWAAALLAGLSMPAQVGAAAVPDHDRFANAARIDVLPFRHATSTVGATIEAGEPSPPCAFVMSTVWYGFVWPEAAVFRVTTESSELDTFVAAYEGASLESLSLAGCANGSGHGATLDLPVSAGARLWLQVGGAAGGAGPLVLGIDAISADPCPGCPPACTDPSYGLLGFEMAPGFRWSVRGATIPEELPPRKVLDAIRRGVRNIERGRNDCGSPDRVDLRAQFLGPAPVRSSFSDHEPGRCVADRRSVVDFGPLPYGVFAQACITTRIHRGRKLLSQADIRFNALFTWWTGRGPCADAYDVEGVMSHEWGHAVGLDHVQPSLLTMSLREPQPCSSEWRTLGRGDLRGLRALY